MQNTLATRNRDEHDMFDLELKVVPADVQQAEASNADPSFSSCPECSNPSWKCTPPFRR
ncbi:hypothetical protein [Sciscionella marina]|uniref:hypothetical protein n=1 Tax=Sciscionella marina TaxID=508770 RepID=UPI00037F5D19|nr:hypothetical protein [Sciscionella marina]